MTKAKPTEKVDHFLHKHLPRETRERQTPTQRRCGGGSKFRIGCTLDFLFGKGIAELEVLELWKEANKTQDLTARSFGFFESEESEIRCEASEVLFDGRHEAGYLETIDPELPEVLECGEIAELQFFEPLEGEARGVADG